ACRQLPATDAAAGDAPPLAQSRLAAVDLAQALTAGCPLGASGAPGEQLPRGWLVLPVRLLGAGRLVRARVCPPGARGWTPGAAGGGGIVRDPERGGVSGLLGLDQRPGRTIVG